ncbi:uncharacterized protein LOC123506116 isoform X2 [Portunus trituberculatus]|uniref:uncharacterized protein LOC123506116 isoform X2 n=1 Tax=Portunus trituberculatus TaxID=210409 RepID=UPI001E1CEAA5|nr:uncharacterized protein LOC123506116 isoform X2 [Portunus trituberculatus]
MCDKAYLNVEGHCCSSKDFWDCQQMQHCRPGSLQGTLLEKTSQDMSNAKELSKDERKKKALSSEAAGSGEACLAGVFFLACFCRLPLLVHWLQRPCLHPHRPILAVPTLFRDDGSFKHVVALMFAIEDFVSRFGTNLH